MGLRPGFALDSAAAILKDGGVESALLHGGTSTAVAIGIPPEAEIWKVAVSPPDVWKRARKEEDRERALAVVALSNDSLSISAVSGKGFQFGDQYYGHVLDPRTGYPVSRWDIAVVRASSATASDALSTALLVGGPDILQKAKESGVVDGYTVANWKLASAEPDQVRDGI